MQRFVERITRLYEQGADEIRIGKYVRRWLIWLTTGVPPNKETRFGIWPPMKWQHESTLEELRVWKNQLPFEC